LTAGAAAVIMRSVLARLALRAYALFLIAGLVLLTVVLAVWVWLAIVAGLVTVVAAINLLD
jgi:hypothetical protein